MLVDLICVSPSAYAFRGDAGYSFLYAYVDNICYRRLYLSGVETVDIHVKWRNLPIIPSHSAMNELFRYGMDLQDVKQVLEEGADCAESKRSSGTYERSLRVKDRIIKVVVAESYNFSLKTDCWIVVHIGSVRC